MIVPLTVGKVFGGGNHHFEIAGGFIFARRANEIYDNPEPTERFVFLTGFVGYRYQVMNKRFFFELDSIRSGGCTIALKTKVPDHSILGLLSAVDLDFD